MMISPVFIFDLFDLTPIISVLWTLIPSLSIYCFSQWLVDIFVLAKIDLSNLSYICINPRMWRWRVVLALAPETGFFYGSFFAPYPKISPL